MFTEPTTSAAAAERSGVQPNQSSRLKSSIKPTRVSHHAQLERDQLELSLRTSERVRGPITAIFGGVEKRADRTIVIHDLGARPPDTLHLVIEGGANPDPNWVRDVEGTAYISGIEKEVAIFR